MAAVLRDQMKNGVAMGCTSAGVAGGGCREAAGAALSGRAGVLVVDVQGDFTTHKDGSLAVPGSDAAYVDAVRRSTRVLRDAGLPVYATQDWHPREHMSFYTNHPGAEPFQAVELDDGRTHMVWPPHCVQHTEGAELLVDRALLHRVVQKGTDPRHDSYSGFRDDGGADTGLDAALRKDGIRTLVVYGIATDYCVKATAIDARKAGYDVVVVAELCRGVAPDTSKAALDEMRAQGIRIADRFDPARLAGP